MRGKWVGYGTPRPMSKIPRMPRVIPAERQYIAMDTAKQTPEKTNGHRRGVHWLRSLVVGLLLGCPCLAGDGMIAGLVEVSALPIGGADELHIDPDLALAGEPLRKILSDRLGHLVLVAKWRRRAVVLDNGIHARATALGPVGTASGGLCGCLCCSAEAAQLLCCFIFHGVGFWGGVVGHAQTIPQRWGFARIIFNYFSRALLSPHNMLLGQP